MKQVMIYSTPSCHYCNMAKAYFKEKGVVYTEFDVAENMEKRQEMIKRSGQMGVPVIVIGNDILVGFNEEKVSGLLGL